MISIGMPMENHTKTGLLLLIIGFGLAILEELISFSTSGLVDLSFSGWIILIGMILMFVGRKEFGKRHQKFVIISIILFLISFIMTIIFAGYLIFSVYSAVSNSSFDSLSSIDFSFMKNIFLIAPIAAVLGGLTNIFLVYDLEDRRGVIILFTAFFVLIVTSMYILITGAAIVEEWTNEVQDALENRNYLIPPEIETVTDTFKTKLSQTSIVAIFSNLLFLIAFMIPYQRIKSGELTPALSSNLKRCTSCGRASPSDSIICAYCGNRFNELQNENINLGGNYRSY